MDGLQTGMMLPDILFKFLLMNSNGLGPTMRWIKSMLFSKGGIAAAKVPKLFARVCTEKHQCLSSHNISTHDCETRGCAMNHSGTAGSETACTSSQSQVFCCSCANRQAMQKDADDQH